MGFTDQGENGNNTSTGNDTTPNKEIDTSPVSTTPVSTMPVDYFSSTSSLNLNLGFSDPLNLPSLAPLATPAVAPPPQVQAPASTQGNSWMQTISSNLGLNNTDTSGNNTDTSGNWWDSAVENLNPNPTTSAMPSIPSISNVGSVPFTGTVSTIPGGFQPLPQTAGGRKKLYQLSKFHGGLNQKSSPRDIADFECQEATNVTVSSIGRIKLLGDCLNTNNGITTESSQKADRGAAGYGLFQFTAPAATDATAGEYVITLAPSGDEIDAHDSTGTTNTWITYGGTDDHDVAHVIYAAGNGVYANDANFRASSDNPRKAKIYVYREDAGGTVKGWEEGLPLIISPHNETTAAGETGAVTLVDASSGDGTANTDGEFLVNICDGGLVGADSGGTGSWDGTYYFYVSYLFDGGCETGLTSIGTIVFDGETLRLNPSIQHEASADGTGQIGGDPRIEGARIYFKESGTTERWLLAELNMIDGVKGALDSTFIPWTIGSDVHDLDDAVRIVFEAPPSVYSYSSLNGYYANEVYDISSDTAPDGDGVSAHDLRYKAAVVGSGGIVFIGNVKFKGKHMPDSMMFSMPGKPGVFPQYNRFDSPSSDGSPITALAAYRDTIVQFKENGMYVINVSNPNQFYAQASFRDCGVFNPCQVFTTSFGVIFANKNGCYIYDGQRVTSLTDGKFGFVSWDLPNTAGNTSGVEGSSIGADATGVPCVGYDPRSQSIVVLKDINDDSTSTGAFVYNMVTQSWTEGSSMITNANTNRHTNFIITSGGYLSILRDDNTALENYNHDKLVDTGAQTITYQTKDMDFGLPSQTKKLFKVYITYKGTPPSTINYRIDGSSTVYGFTETNWAAAGVDDYEVATLVPDTTSEGKDWKSISIYMTGSATSTFEINDISILYRVRPIK